MAKYKPKSAQKGFRGPAGAGKATRFKHGQSGNPGGRPKSKHVSDAYLADLEQIDAKTGKTRAELIARAMVNKAIRGFVGAAQEITNRTEGKAMQPVRVDVGIDDATARLIAELSQTLLLPSQTMPSKFAVGDLHPSDCHCTPCDQKRRAQREQETAKQLGQVQLLGKADAGPEQRTDRAQLRDGLAVPRAI